MSDRALSVIVLIWVALCLGLYLYQFHDLFGPVLDTVRSILGI